MPGSAVIGALRVNLGIDSAQFQKGLKDTQKGLSKFSKAMKVGMVAVATGAGIAMGALAKSVGSTIDAADEMSKSAQKIGIPIEELSRLKYAADLSGVSMDTLEGAIKRLSSNMVDGVAKPTGAAAKQFADMGIELKNADGSMRSSSDVMADIADVLAKMPDGAGKTAAAMKLMGKSGADMIPLLNGGSEALKTMMGEADTFGQVFTSEMGANAEVFNDNLSKLTGLFGSLSAKIATAVLPYLTRFTDWLVANAPMLNQWASNVGAAVGEVVRQFALAKQDINTLITAVQSLIQWFDDLDAGIRAAGEAVRGAFASAWEAVVTAVATMRDRVLAVIDEVVAGIRTKLAALPAEMAQLGADIAQGLANGIASKAYAVNGAIDSFMHDWVIDPARAAVGAKSPSRVFHELGINIGEGLANGIGTMSGVVAAASDEMAKGAIAPAKDALGDLNSTAESVFSGIGGTFAELIKGTKSWKDALSEVLGKLGDIALQSVFGGGSTGWFGGGGGGGLGGLLSGLFGGLTGFANGGNFKVGGSGGIDSQLVAFRASPSEHVSVSKAGNDNARGGNVHVTVGWSRTADGNLRPFVEDVSRATAAPMVREGMKQANDAVVPTLGRYQGQRAGGDYRVG